MVVGYRDSPWGYVGRVQLTGCESSNGNGRKHVQLKLRVCEQTFQLANYHQNTRNVEANIDFALQKFKGEIKGHFIANFNFRFHLAETAKD